MLEHMDVRAGLKKHHASDAGAVARDKTFKGQRDAKKKAYAAGEAARAARAEAQAAQEQARADELVATLAELTELTEEETAALIAKGGRAVESARRAFVARATDVALETKGPAGAKKTKRRQQDREYSEDYRKQKKAKVEGLVQDEAQLTEECVGLLRRLGCGAEKLGLGDDDASGLIDKGAFREEEEAIEALVGKDKRYRARQKLKLKKDQRRVEALTGRVEELEKQVCLLEDALSLI